MKKLLLVTALAAGTLGAGAQSLALMPQKFTDNWKLGVEGGVTTPLNHGAFFGDMRAMVGLNLRKQITPTFGMGVEGLWDINSSSWNGRTHSGTAFDRQYVGLYGSVNLFKLFGGYTNNTPFNIEVVGGAGWGHYFQCEPIDDVNFFATKAGLNFNYDVSDRVTISLKPSVLFDMTSKPHKQTTASYDKNLCSFNLLAGVSVRLGNGFEFVRPYDANEVADLNNKINDLRGQLDACANTAAALDARNRALDAELAACKNRKPTVVTKTDVQNNLYSVRYVNFLIGRTNITKDQMPNVEAVADYLKHHEKSTVVIKGYASQDGPLELNERLARERAESVKNTLVKKYGIKADRIKAEGEGIGHMFTEESWNRVAICTVDAN